MFKTKSVFLFTTIALVMACATTIADDDDLLINGYGTWYYGATNNNNIFLGADENGNYENMLFAIRLTKNFNDRVRAVAQINWENLNNNREDVVSVRYLYADVTLNEYFTLRIGQSNHPFGMYSEFFDVGTLRPFITLPESVYNSYGFAKAYRGVGLRGSYYMDNGWGFDADVYFGELQYEYEVRGIWTVGGEYSDFQSFVNSDDNDETTMGTKLTVTTPLEGVTIGGAFYQTTPDNDGSDTYAWTVSGEYTLEGLTLKGEMFRNGIYDSWERNFYFVEGSYKLENGLQFAGRYEWGETDLGVTTFEKTFLEHTEGILGLNYWLSPTMVLKGSWHFIEGNNFVYPNFDDMLDLFVNGGFETDTQMYLLGFQFSF